MVSVLRLSVTDALLHKNLKGMGSFGRVAGMAARDPAMAGSTPSVFNTHAGLAKALSLVEANLLRLGPARAGRAPKPPPDRGNTFSPLRTWRFGSLGLKTCRFTRYRRVLRGP